MTTLSVLYLKRLLAVKLINRQCYCIECVTQLIRYKMKLQKKNLYERSLRNISDGMI